MKIRHLAMAVTLALGVSNMAFADTSSAIRGNVVTATGEVAANARVEILHVPSGTRSVATTNQAGAFASSGLRVGGPYTITITSPQGTKVYNNIFISLGESFRINAELEAQQVERIAVTGTAILAGNTGSSSYFGAKDIENAPSFTRDIKDIVRNNPLAVLSSKDGELSVAGTNPRFNSISIDGIAQNDDFGLNANGYPTTRSPISLAAIEQVTIDVSPFKAKDSGFQGAKINAVTKSGTNELSGSVFYETQNDKMAGTPKDRGRDRPIVFDEYTYGATLGGAVVKDKLFFFASYEYFEADTVLEWGPIGAGASNDSRVTQAEYDAIRRIATQVYRVEPGVWDSSPVVDDKKFLLKLDWNINDDHRAAFTYQYTKGNRTANTSNNGDQLRLSSHWYNRIEELNNYAFKLYSDWTPDFSTQASVTYINNPTTQASFGDFGQVIVNLGDSRSVAIGSDISRHSNDLRKKSLIMALDADYLIGDHSVSFGYEFKQLDIFNLFLQRTKGQYTFSSINDFEARRANYFRYTNHVSLDANNAAAEFVRQEHSVYVHDEWAVNPDVTIDAGLRYEWLSSNDRPEFNTQSQARTGLSNTENLDGVGILLPRFGIKWDATDDLTLRGGFGRFSGGQPTVWVSNSYSNPGVGIGNLEIDPANNVNAALANALENISISEIPTVALDRVSNSTTFAGTNLVDPNFKLPSDWRFLVAADYRLDIPYFGDNVMWTTEFTYKKPKDSAFWVDASMLGKESGTTLDGGRFLYTLNQVGGRTTDIMLTNSDKEGRSKIFSTMLSKNWSNGLSMTTSYTHQDITDAHTSTSATAGSNYGFNTSINRNFADVGTSTFETKHRLVLNLGYEHEFFAGYKTNFNMFFERRSGKPITFFGRGFDLDGRSRPGTAPFDLISPGTTTSGGLLVYIPTANDPNVVFVDTFRDNGTLIKTAAQNRADFFRAVEAFGLDKYAGGYAPRASNKTPWVTTLDLSIRQEIPGFMDGHKGVVYMVVDNFLNLLDSTKGKVYGSDFGTFQLVDFTIDPATRQYQYGGARTDLNNFDKFYAEDSTWRIKVGVTYRF
ncbi:OmpA family Oar-like outer membrane protein [Alishewanella aestuarii B11]|uniref:OmpA family Oar-like outer membrane protein n=1 Tax=Alishewanella aestuarii B11 TaxID=1197174 RepID=J1YBQ1_9ALTE|nr:TonB-dependent receptor [Alishewanella aestuarii]EJI85285.1 OmpA family Oar-like outer membrane protein [Alishewanella aestuarii B11]